MRNLKVLDSDKADKLPSLSEALFLTVDTDCGTIYVATNTSLIAFCPTDKQIKSSIPLHNEGSDAPSPPVGLQYLFDQQSVCVATREGRMSLWQDQAQELECVGEVAQGLTSMTWSPDLELVVITTGDDTLIIMTREFDALTEVPIVPVECGEETPVNVGWGKKETQFHGSAGKQAAKVQEVHVSPADPRDHRRPIVRWRGDGEFFVVSAINPHTDARGLYTWSRECVFQSASEPVDGLQHTLDWKPSGSLIASVQKNCQLKAQDVVFFEKNGLRHGEFRLPNSSENNIFVQSLSWNQDSSVLAVCYDEINEVGDASGSIIQLWTVNNYHWYLKQSLTFGCGVSVCQWDTQAFCRLHLVTREGRYLSYTWAWTTEACGSTDAGHLASVAVIDGAKLLVTPMRAMVVPPPMAAFTLAHPAPVNCVTFNLSSGSNDLAAVMADGRVAFWKYNQAGNDTATKGRLDAAGGDGFTPRCEAPQLMAVVEIKGIDKSDIPLQVTNLVWLSEEVVLFSTLGEEVSVIHTADLKLGEKSLIVRSSVPMESHVRGMTPTFDRCGVVIQLQAGELLKYMPESSCMAPHESEAGSPVTFPSPCTTTAVTLMGGQEVVLGLTDNFRFYVNDVEIASNCTSFAVHNDFLILTTLTHTIRCISKTTNVSDLPKLSDGKAHPFDESIRRVERGSRAVTVVGDDTKLVLQMPRGNLEVIHPRALVLSTLRQMLDSGRVKEAFVIMRKHRINMNLLYDHCPAHFLENIDSILSQIQSVNHINLFLTDLLEDDVTRTMYTASYHRDLDPDQDSLDPKPKAKVDLICDAALAAFKRLDHDKYLLSTITALVRKTCPELEQALLLVWSLHGQDAPPGGVTADQALKYLLFLVDVNSLYDVALGTYNFDLVMMVAQRSQKDPKEYIPFLNELRRLEETYRYYTIDKYLKKYPKALEHIAKCGLDHFEECVTLVVDHKLYSSALRFLTPGSAQHKRVCGLYGSYLRSKNRHDEAGIMYIKAEEWESALDAFSASHDWRQVLCMAARLEYGTNRLAELAVKLAGDLKSRHKFAEAAQVLDTYAQDHEEAIAALIEGSHWDEALHMMHRYKRLDLVETHLREALEEALEHTLDQLTDRREAFLKHRRRLGVVRQGKIRDRDMMDGAGDYNDADADLFSDTTSMTGGSVRSHTTANSNRSTVFSKVTGSSRSRRKAEQKKWSLKEGSANEEFALVDALAQIIKNVDGMKEEASRLMRALVQFHYDSQAAQLQEALGSLLGELHNSVKDIWVYTPGTGPGAMALGPHSTATAIAQAMQAGHILQAEEDKLDPVLLVPPPFSKDLKWKLHIASADDKNA